MHSQVIVAAMVAYSALQLSGCAAQSDTSQVARGCTEEGKQALRRIADEIAKDGSLNVDVMIQCDFLNEADFVGVVPSSSSDQVEASFRKRFNCTDTEIDAPLSCVVADEQVMVGFGDGGPGTAEVGFESD
jgi:hypothetical protein